MNPLGPSEARMRASKSSESVEDSTVLRNASPFPAPTAASKAATTASKDRALTCSQWISVLSSCIMALDDGGVVRSQVEFMGDRSLCGRGSDGTTVVPD